MKHLADLAPKNNCCGMYGNLHYGSCVHALDRVKYLDKDIVIEDD